MQPKGNKLGARQPIKINHDFERDLQRFYAQRHKYKFIQARDDNNSFVVMLPGKKYAGSYRFLDEAEAARDAALKRVAQ